MQLKHWDVIADGRLDEAERPTEGSDRLRREVDGFLKSVSDV